MAALARVAAFGQAVSQTGPRSRSADQWQHCAIFAVIGKTMERRLVERIQQICTLTCWSEASNRRARAEGREAASARRRYLKPLHLLPYSLSLT